MNKNTRFLTLAVAGLVALVISNLPFLLFESQSQLAFALFLFTGRLLLSAAVAAVLLKKAQFSFPVLIAVTASFGAYFLAMLATIPIVYSHTATWLDWPLTGISFIGAFWLSNYLFNGWRVRLRYRVAFAGIVIAVLAVIAPVISLYAERLAIARDDSVLHR